MNIEEVKKICCKQCDMIMEGEPCYVDKDICDVLATIPELICQLSPQPSTDSGITCPFCGDSDFDLIGLKYHLSNYCKVFQDTEVVGL